MKIQGTRNELWERLKTPAIAAAIQKTQHARAKMYDYQYAAIYLLAQPHDGGRILDIGAFKGRSALILSYACPGAEIISLDPYRFAAARDNTQQRDNITVIKQYSWRYLAAHPEGEFHLVMVDGNHKKIRIDVPWFDRLAPEGLILFHDYSPELCTHVYQCVNEMGRCLGREPDVVVMDDTATGMAGFYRRDNEELGDQWRVE